MGINWTKHWVPGDDGAIMRGIDLRNLQDDIDAYASVNPSTGYVSVSTDQTITGLKTFTQDPVFPSSGALATAVKGDGTVNPTNILHNGSFELWTNNPTGPKSLVGWYVSGAGATVDRETTLLKVCGYYAAKVTMAGADASIVQAINDTNGSIPSFYMRGNPVEYYRGKTLTLGVWAYATVASRVRVTLADGVGVTYSSYHTGDSTWQYLKCSRTISSAATYVSVNLMVDSGDTSGYFDGASLVEGSSLFSYTPDWRDLTDVRIPSTVYGTTGCWVDGASYYQYTYGLVCLYSSQSIAGPYGVKDVISLSGDGHTKYIIYCYASSAGGGYGSFHAYFVCTYAGVCQEIGSGYSFGKNTYLTWRDASSVNLNFASSAGGGEPSCVAVFAQVCYVGG